VFKNVMVYRIGSAWSAAVDQVEANLHKQRFVPCSASQEQSIGWIEPRGVANGPLVESIGGHWMLKLQIENKVVPGSVIKRKVEELAAHIELTEGRKPGKKERKDIRDNAMLELLPMAFTKQAAVQVWLDPVGRMLTLDAGSQGRADAVMTCLMEAVPGLTVELIQTTLSPAVCMSGWLSSFEAPAGFSIDRECELKSPDENKATVRYVKHALDIDEVRQHIEGGKVPTKLAMTWEGRVSFVLTENMQVKKLSFLEGVFEGTSGEKEDKFDADMAITTGELSQLIPDLLLALGGEQGVSLAGTASLAMHSEATVSPSITVPKDEGDHGADF
jgi:recombination associated protein RdgC